MLPPKYASPSANSAIATRLMQHLRITDEDTKIDLAAAIAQGNTIGVCTGDDGRVTLTTSRSFSRFAYLVLIRCFFRTRFGIEMRQMIPGSRSARLAQEAEGAGKLVIDYRKRAAAGWR